MMMPFHAAPDRIDTRPVLLAVFWAALRRAYAHRALSEQQRLLRLMVGGLVTLVGIAFIEAMEAWVVALPNPTLVLLLAVVLAAAIGGLLTGLVSVAVTLGYAGVEFSMAGHPFRFDSDDALRVALFGLAAPTAAVVIGILKDLADRNLLAVQTKLGEMGRRFRHAQSDAERALLLEVAQREMAEEQARQALEELTAIVDAAPVAIFAIDRERRVRMWNRAAVEITGYRREEVLGQPYPLLAQDREEFERRVAAVARGEQLRDVEVVRKRRDGRPITARFSAAALYDEKGEVRGAVCIAEDVTERRNMQRQLAHAHKMDAVGQLTGGIAHDFNNLLGIVIGNLDLLELQAGGDGEARELAESALKAALRGAELTKQLLAFARKQPLKPQSLDLNASVTNVAGLLRRTLGEQIQISVRKAADLWTARADPTQVETALTNLAINARDAMTKGGKLTIETSNVRLDEEYADAHIEVKPGDYVMLAITDTGTGIPPDILDRVFDPFFTTKAEGKGTGLGLSMVYGFVKQSGGHVKIYSEPGHGTTVRLYLPRAERAIVAEIGPEEVQARGHGETILVVEDNPGVRAVAVKQLIALGYRVLEASNAASALESLRGEQPVDVLFTDVVMPGGTGVELAAEAGQLRPHLKVLLTSGFSEAAMRDREGVDQIPMLSKPYRQQDLARMINQVLSAGPTTAAL